MKKEKAVSSLQRPGASEMPGSAGPSGLQGPGASEMPGSTGAGPLGLTAVPLHSGTEDFETLIKDKGAISLHSKVAQRSREDRPSARQ